MALWLQIVYTVEPVVAGIALLVFAPIAAVIAIAIVALSRRGPSGPAPESRGWRGMELPVLKFRTMWRPGDAPGPLFAIEDVSGAVPVSKAGGDARVRSRFAAVFAGAIRWMRFPQLYHVARGEMSLVGPRPITLAELERHYGSCAEEVLSVRPGLTGLWQIMGRNRLNYARRKRLDLWFVRRASARLYLGILRRSIACVFSGRGAY